MSNSREILPTISGGLIHCFISLSLVEYLSPYMYWFSYICPKNFLHFYQPFITLCFSPQFWDNTFKFTASVFYSGQPNVLYTAFSAFSILIIMFFIRKLSLWSHIIPFLFLNAARTQVPVNIKNKIYILVSLTVSWKGVYVCLYSNMEGTYIFLLKSIALTV